MQSDQIHIDVESLSTKFNAQLLSIGAVIGDETFYMEIDISLYPPDGTFITDDKTIEWWAKQGGFTPSELPVSPYHAMVALANWIGKMTEDLDDFEIWANSPSFDCSILNYHFQVFNITYPWHFWQERDVRTIKNLSSKLRLPIAKYKNPHHALEDAKNQQKMVDSVFMTLAQSMQVVKDRQDLRSLELAGNAEEHY